MFSIKKFLKSDDNELVKTLVQMIEIRNNLHNCFHTKKEYTGLVKKLHNRKADLLKQFTHTFIPNDPNAKFDLVSIEGDLNPRSTKRIVQKTENNVITFTTLSKFINDFFNIYSKKEETEKPKKTKKTICTNQIPIKPDLNFSFHQPNNKLPTISIAKLYNYYNNNTQVKTELNSLRNEIDNLYNNEPEFKLIITGTQKFISFKPVIIDSNIYAVQITFNKVKEVYTTLAFFLFFINKLSSYNKDINSDFIIQTFPQYFILDKDI